ncbi:hypothetical protein V6N13_082376 [Hibiscus sabdariffa]|uniref:AP2/ERF domain-containing protein n=1 Tax=Hibiscus sabdariffa TaxID=183260 RepID=A0ABR2Q3D1_9ROSI
MDSSATLRRLFQAAEEDAGGGTPATTAGATDLPAFKGGPKLEDFLGGSPSAPQRLPLHHNLSTRTPVNVVALSGNDIYDSELKTIAASFLRGFSSQQTDIQPQQVATAEPAPKRGLDTFGQRTSIYRGVTRHRWTGRYEAHLWDNSCRRQGTRKGRQELALVLRMVEDSDVLLLALCLPCGYDKEDKAARAYDLAALKYWGPTTTTNFPISNYEKELKEMKNMTKQEFVASLRRKSSGFSRGASIYRGVTRHHQHGRWQARIGRVAGNKDLYLGTFSTQEEAAEAYDIAAIKFRGLNAVTNFDMSRYDMKSIVNSNLPIGGLNTKSRNCSDSASDSKSMDRDHCSGIAIPIKQDPSGYWSNVFGYGNTSGASLSTIHQPSNEGTGFQSPNGYSSAYGVNGGGYEEHQHESNVGTGSLQFAMPVVSRDNDNNNDEKSSSPSGYGKWKMAESFHSYQTAKQSLSVLQKPIFGME